MLYIYSLYLFAVIMMLSIFLSRVSCYMDHLVREKLFLLGLWHITLIAHLFESLVLNWFKNTLERGQEWLGSFLSWQGMLQSTRYD